MEGTCVCASVGEHVRLLIIFFILYALLSPAFPHPLRVMMMVVMASAARTISLSPSLDIAMPRSLCSVVINACANLPFPLVILVLVDDAGDHVLLEHEDRRVGSLLGLVQPDGPHPCILLHSLLQVVVLRCSVAMDTALCVV